MGQVLTGFVDRARGKTSIATQYMSRGASFFANAEDNIIATPSGTQATSRLLGQQQSRITTVTTAGDGVSRDDEREPAPRGPQPR
jgi:hypothetical protein